MSLATSNRDGGRTSESGHLRSLTKAFPGGGVLEGLVTSQRGAGANMSVDLSIGDCIIPRSDNTYSHPAWNDAVLNNVVTTADVSNPRRDILVIYIDYAQTPSTGVSNNTNGVVKTKIVAGTPAGSPADPSSAAIQSSVGSGNPWIYLSRIRVGAGVTTITNSVIDDLRSWATPVAANNAIPGQLMNGKIVRTVASNNITVAIKTLAGNDPSDVDPVYIRIGDVVRKLNAALSVTKNAGTNWMASGSASLATQEVDYFVYLGYNVTDGITIGFSRIPWALTYSDFSATSTVDTYAAISTITNATATDVYQLAGRFNATLSATASFNWSVPATDVTINRPIFETRELTYIAAWTNLSKGNGTESSTYILRNRNVRQRVSLGWGTTTSISGNVTLAPVITPNARYGTTSYNPLGVGSLVDEGSSVYKGTYFLNSSTTSILVAADGAAGTYVNAASTQITSTIPHTWANTDRISAILDYTM